MIPRYSDRNPASAKTTLSAGPRVGEGQVINEKMRLMCHAQISLVDTLLHVSLTYPLLTSNSICNTSNYRQLGLES